MADESKHSGRRPDKPLAKPVRIYPAMEEISEDIPPIIDPEGPREPQLRKLLSVIAIIIVFIIIVYLLRFPLSSLFSSRLYITLAVENTMKSLNRELMAFASGNRVVKRGVALLQEPNEHILQVNPGAFGIFNHQLDFKMQNDSKRNQLMLEISKGSSENASFYLTDFMMGLRINNDVYAVDPTAAREDLNALLEANAYNIRLPLGLDISYNACKRFIMGGSLSAVAPAYDRIYTKYSKLFGLLLDTAKYKKSSRENVSLTGKIVKCNVITMQITSQSMREWMIELADAIKADDDLAMLFGSLQKDFEIAVRGQRFFHNGDIIIRFLCYDNKIISVRYSHLESQIFFEAATIGEKYRLDTISFSSSGAREFTFKAVGSHISSGEYRTNLHVRGLGKIDALDKLQIVWEPDNETDNVTLGKNGKVVRRLTFAENEDSIVINIPAVHSNDAGVLYTLTKMEKRPEWPDEAKSFAEIDLNWFKALLK